MRCPRWTPLATLVLALAPGARAAEVLEWPIEVPRAGTWEVALDAEAMAALTPAGGVEVLDPRGQPVAATRFAADRGERCREIEAAELERAGERWRVRLRVPEEIGPHAALRFELEDTVLASDCRLESVDALGLATELGRADLFRIGEDASLARTRFDYPATTARDLVLSWPAAAGFPRVRAVSVCAPEDAERRIRIPAGRAETTPVAGGASRARWRVPPAVQLRAIEVELGEPASAGVGYRLRASAADGWREVARGHWALGARTLRLQVEGALGGADTIALDLEGVAPERLPATWEAEPESVRFEAAEAGLHTLRLPAPARARGPVRGEGAPVGLGPSQSAERRLRAPEPGAELAEAGFRRSWEVESAAAPGEPVELRLPSGVLAVSRRDLADLRLEVAGRMIAARLAPAGPPVSLVSLSELSPSGSENGRSRWELELPGAEREAEPVQLLVRAARREAPFGRPVQLSVVPPPEGRRPPVARVASSSAWSCAGDEPVSCELALAVSAPPGSRLVLEIVDGDSAPLAALGLELVGRVAALRFQWPDRPPRLHAGAPALGPARFDFAALDAALEIAHPLPARLGPARDLGTGPGESWAKLLLFGAVALVALVLLALLRRLLPPAGRAG